MIDFLHNIFSRGQYAGTDSPAVIVGGMDTTSATITADFVHMSGGAVLVHTVNAASGTASSIGAGGTISFVALVGTVSFVANVGTMSSLLSGTMTANAIWTQRLDASNDAVLSYGSARTTDILIVNASSSNSPMITDSLGKQVVLPGAVGDLTMRGSFQGAGVLAQALITTPGSGRRIAVQAVGITCSASEALNVILSGGPANLTFGPFVPTGGISMNAGGAPLYITSASTNLSVAGSTTASFGIVATGYQMSN